MNTKETFENTISIGNEIKKYERKISDLNIQAKIMMDLCPHEIVFKYNDNNPHKAVFDGHYFCPACGLTQTLLLGDDIGKTPFKYAKIIPLPNLSLVSSKQLFSTIRREVYYNMDVYYNSDVSIEELSNEMEYVLNEDEEAPKQIIFRREKSKDVDHENK